jgi:hypothetical protein
VAITELLQPGLRGGGSRGPPSGLWSGLTEHIMPSYAWVEYPHEKAPVDGYCSFDPRNLDGARTQIRRTYYSREGQTSEAHIERPS